MDVFWCLMLFVSVVDVYLFCLAPPIFTETSPPVVEALLGRPITLRCVVRGNPPPRVTWAKNGVLLKQNNTEVRGRCSLRTVTSHTYRLIKLQSRCMVFNPM